MKKLIAIFLYFVFFTTQGFAMDFYVSSIATGNGDGSFGNPWKLQQALNSPAAITNPLDTVWIWLIGGIYKDTFDTQTSFSCFTNGSAAAPVIFRNYNNKRAAIDSQLPNTLVFALGNCSYTWFWGMEVMNADTTDRDHSNVNRKGNIYCTAEHIKFINLIVHDMGSGLDSWKTASNTETYGCIIYNIGNNLLNGINWEGHGHGMYLQNDTIGIKTIHNNIIFNTYGYGIHAWQTTTTSAFGNFDFQRNIVFNGGAASENMGGVGNNSRTHNLFFVSNGTNNPIRNTVIKHNYTYSGINTPRPPVNAFGLNAGVDNLILDSNFITCQTRLGLSNTPIFNASVAGNKFIAGIPVNYGYYLWGFTDVDYPQNTYLPIEPTEGLDYFVLPNQYEQGRAHIVIYNWESADNVQIDISNTDLEAGDIYELVNVMDYYQDVIKDTLQASKMINVPMIGHTFAPVIGSSKNPVSQFPVFGAFVIRKIGQATITNISIHQSNIPLNIYPNPTCDICRLNFTITQPGNYNLIVTDIQGKPVLQQSGLYFNQGNHTLEMNLIELSDGLYVIHLNNEKVSMQEKVVLCK